jgi:hypothetical protein
MNNVNNNILNDLSNNNTNITETNDTEKIVNQITLACLINKEQYNKYMSSTKKTTNKKERKFYRKRILQLTKDILTNEAPATLTNDIHLIFDSYANMCIQYFKMIDKTDLLQNEYNNMMVQEEDVDGIPESENLMSNTEIPECVNQLMMRTIKIDNTLDKFVKKTILKKEKVIPLPVQKEINLKDPALRIKGIRKKKNIDTNYEGKDEKQ